MKKNYTTTKIKTTIEMKTEIAMNSNVIHVIMNN